MIEMHRMYVKKMKFVFEIISINFVLQLKVFILLCLVNRIIKDERLLGIANAS